MRLPFRKGILLGIGKLMGKKASQSVYLKNFYSEYLPLTTSLTGYYIARVLHYSAAALAAGLIFGLWLRGFATAYVAGWESTWLYDYPHIVEVILKGLYGFLPVQDALINGLTVEKVEPMRFGADYVANSCRPLVDSTDGNGCRFCFNTQNFLRPVRRLPVSPIGEILPVGYHNPLFPKSLEALARKNYDHTRCTFCHFSFPERKWTDLKELLPQWDTAAPLSSSRKRSLKTIPCRL